MDVKEKLKKISESVKRTQALIGFCEALASGTPVRVSIGEEFCILINPEKTQKDDENGDALMAIFSKMIRDEENILQNLVRPR